MKAKKDCDIIEVGISEKELTEFIKRLMMLEKGNHTHLKLDKNKEAIIFLK
ncbi:MAG: hypothetical protein Q8N99_05185 [Nanoarchaeota archaeon]|nr:hypothetical protein [Nanoarchaeota archaeon]